MKEPHIIHQIWPFTCLTCRHTWESAYEAWHTDDGRGGQVITWRQRGTASTPPWIEPSCPACSSLHVKNLPPGTKSSTGDRAARNGAGTEYGGAQDARERAGARQNGGSHEKDARHRRSGLPKINSWPHRATGNASGR
jgi:hypothetical protein